MRIIALDAAIDTHSPGYRLVDAAIVVSIFLVPVLVVRRIWRAISR